MEQELNNLRKAMNSSTHKGIRFTERQKEKIKAAIQQEPFNGKRKPTISIYFITALAASLFVLLFYKDIVSNLTTNEDIMQGKELSFEDEWEVRNDYSRNGKLMFSIFEDPYLSAGKPFGYIFSFKESFESYEGKELEIYAVHKETGERLNVLSSTKITEPSPGYSSLGRFTARMLIPKAGHWKYEVYFDKNLYGDVVLEVQEEKFLPVNIPQFVQKTDFEKIDWNRKAVNLGNNILGNKNKSGVIGALIPSLDISQKWMWLFWGIDNPKETKVTVVGYHRETETVHQILTTGWTFDLGGANKGADAHAPSNVNIPLSGEWAIFLYVDGKVFDVLVFDINQ
ncbi:helix-turn-helix domain-containing protein [Cytobacillus massiliigabonensis]|uniref:hypothetical protein n=1 Tax=Cytobacillus massiliigabonensis TaxID=1871011 RepID=UPI000C85FCC5|nr:hypothetical protein [Cytobacillus massiliigabonensis]